MLKILLILLLIGAALWGAWYVIGLFRDDYKVK